MAITKLHIYEVLAYASNIAVVKFGKYPTGMLHQDKKYPTC